MESIEIWLLIYVLICILAFIVRMWDISTDTESEILREMHSSDIIASTIFMSCLPIINIAMLIDILYTKLIKKKE
jgi:hypothetical protein